MTYKDIVFEMFESATAELEKGNIYSANVLLWACHELFEQANRIDKSGHFDWLLDLWFAKFTNEQIMQAFNQLKEEYPLAKEFETFDDFKQQIKEILITYAILSNMTEKIYLDFFCLHSLNQYLIADGIDITNGNNGPQIQF